MAGNFCIGVLALQGAFKKHSERVNSLGVETLEVRSPADLKSCNGLILPGGESSTLIAHMEEEGFIEPLKHFSKPCFGTCAGMILLSKLGLLQITINRNAYGRQIDSFSAPLNSSQFESLQGIFIRAPRIQSIDSPSVQILAQLGKEPVLVQQGQYLASSFHPELTNDPVIHHYFIQLCKEKQSTPLPSKTTPTKSFQTI